MHWGASVEHAISIRSSQAIVKHFPMHLYHLSIVGMDYQGQCFLLKQTTMIHQITRIDAAQYPDHFIPVVLFSQAGVPCLLELNHHQKIIPFDLAFPLMHGTYGEDGCFQGLLSTYQIPFVGHSVLAAAMTMHKSYTRDRLVRHGVPVIPYALVTDLFHSDIEASSVLKHPLPWMVKPVDAGSSAGVSKVTTLQALNPAIEHALAYSTSVIIEPFIDGRELEVAVLCINGTPRVSKSFGEIKLNPKYSFYDYQAKYLDKHAATLVIPAQLPPDVLEQGRAFALKAFQCLGCNGWARVDFFLTQDGQWLLMKSIPSLVVLISACFHNYGCMRG